MKRVNGLNHLLSKMGGVKEMLKFAFCIDWKHGLFVKAGEMDAL